jgi:hypothetical protein
LLTKRDSSLAVLVGAYVHRGQDVRYERLAPALLVEKGELGHPMNHL